MTCHVAMLAPHGSVMISDSQASDNTSQFHGVQKMVAGPGYLLGGTGAMDIINAVFAEIGRSSPPRNLVEKAIVDFVDSEISNQARGQIEFILAFSDSIKHYRPAMFRNFRTRGAFFSVGSGSEFVFRAFSRDRTLGIVLNNSELHDCASIVETYIKAANESLTVNDKVMLGFAIGEKAYLMGHPSIVPVYISQKLHKNWQVTHGYFDEVMTILGMIRGEHEQAQRYLSAIKQGNLSDADGQGIVLANDAIKSHRILLSEKLNDYVAWYDRILS